MSTPTLSGVIAQMNHWVHDVYKLAMEYELTKTDNLTEIEFFTNAIHGIIFGAIELNRTNEKIVRQGLMATFDEMMELANQFVLANKEAGCKSELDVHRQDFLRMKAVAKTVLRFKPEEITSTQLAQNQHQLA